MKFAIISDIHYGPVDYREVAATSAMERLGELLYRLKEEGVEFIVNLGDNTSGGRSVERLKAVSDIFHDSGIRTFNVLGNSEVRDFGKDDAMALLDMPDRYYSLGVGSGGERFRLIFLDTIFRAENRKRYASYLDEMQIEWLKDEIAPSSIIFSHSPLYPFDVSRSPSSSEEISSGTGIIHISNHARVLRLLSPASDHVVACFSGHLHENMAAIHSGIPFISIQSFSAIRHGKALNSYAIVDIGERMKVSVYGEMFFFQKETGTV